MPCEKADPGLQVRFLASLGSIAAADWDRVAGTDYPFLRHQFLHGLETTGCTTAESGWEPCHLVLEQGGRMVGLLPLYLKTHSYGEYVFDWSWADAWHRCGLSYYPKLVSAIPFTPATGPRLCVVDGLSPDRAWSRALAAVGELADQRAVSSCHILFPEREQSEQLLHLGLPRRMACQFHWFNEGYGDFEDFLQALNSRKRKAIRRERRRVQEQGIELRILQGAEIGTEHWLTFHRFYQLTYAKRSGHGGYLNRDFFLQTAAGMGEQVIMVLAEKDAEPVAAALLFRSSDTLYGRYWGCSREYDCLHFEACYYQGIDYCIRHGLQRFDPGAQGEHKIQRGFRPVPTWSNHWIADPRLADAVADFTREEEPHIRRYIAQAGTLLPFKT